MSAERSPCTQTFTLNNGQHIPAFGLGTWQGSPGSKDEKILEESIVLALQDGYRLIDTAQAYGVEHIVGRAIRASGIPREDITVVTKFWGDWHHNPGGSLSISLEELGLDYVDILLMHWPWATAPDGKPLRKHEAPTFVETWAKMEALVGPKCRGIGVSNFTQKLLDELLPTARIVPAVNQIELHPLNPNHKLVPYCESKGIRVMAWSPLGGQSFSSSILQSPLLSSIAQAHGCSSGVVCLSWVVQRGIIAIPKSSSKSRIMENIRLVTLTDDEMAKINSAHETMGKIRISNGIERLHIEMDGKLTFQGWSYADFGWEDEEGNWLV